MAAPVATTGTTPTIDTIAPPAIYMVPTNKASLPSLVNNNPLAAEESTDPLALSRYSLKSGNIDPKLVLLYVQYYLNCSSAKISAIILSVNLTM